jgi:hypothetical protein
MTYHRDNRSDNTMPVDRMFPITGYTFFEVQRVA